MVTQQLVIVESTVHTRRWVWFDEWRTWEPVFFPVAMQGEWPMFPQVSQVKQELLKSWSYLGVAFKDSDSAAIKVFSTYRTEDSVALNEINGPNVDDHVVGSNSKQNISSGRGPRGSMGDKKDKKHKIPASEDKMQPQSQKDFQDA
ncbi:unnamed protein product [Prorocentrum cordatum]|uniref:Uncharacterized protein n=1 Tax=Prorocentrum cordatum TaxID=2364126 RepID=A0ABN9SYP4_9DINO|nr:unnamed protein product [Polarella glacialis]